MGPLKGHNRFFRLVVCLICQFIFPQNDDLWTFLTNVSNRLVSSLHCYQDWSATFFIDFFYCFGASTCHEFEKKSLSDHNSLIPIASPLTTYHFSGLMSLFRTFPPVFTCCCSLFLLLIHFRSSITGKLLLSQH